MIETSANIISIVCIVLGILVVYKKNLEKFRIYFLSFCVFCASWIYGNIQIAFNNDSESIIFFGKAAFFSAIMINFFLYLFSVEYTKLKSRLPTNIVTIFTLIFSLLSLTSFIVSGVNTTDKKVNNLVYGQAYIPYSIFIFFLLINSSYTLYKFMVLSKNEVKTQAKYMFYGIFVSASLILISNLVIPLVFRTSYFSRFGPLFMSIFLFITFYSIAKHSLFSTSFVFGKALAFIFTGSIAFLTYYSVLLIEIYFFEGPFSNTSYFFSSIVSLFFTYYFVKAFKQINYLLDRSFSFQNFNPFAVKKVYLEKISDELELDSLNMITEKMISNAFWGIGFQLAIFDRNAKNLVYGYSTPTLLLNINQLEKFVYTKHINIPDGVIPLNEVYFVEDPDDISKCFKQYMLDQNIYCIYYFGISENEFVVMFLGNKTNKDVYTKEELIFLDELFLNYQSAITKALLHKQTSEFNKVLKEQIKSKTKKLKKSNQSLAIALRKEKDLVDIFSHELRTPAGTAKSAIIMIEDILKKASADTSVSDIETKTKLYSQIAVTNIRRLSNIISRMLNSVKIDSNQVILTLVPLVINHIVDNSVNTFRENAKRNGLELVYTPNPETITVLSDNDALQQIIDNLVDNAIKYTEKGTVEVKLHYDDKWATVDVLDTGLGIPEEELEKIGRKFYRIDNYQSTTPNGTKILRANGTGIGLYVVKGLIKNMNGKFDIYSEGRNKGSRFSVSIPIAK